MSRYVSWEDKEFIREIVNSHFNLKDCLVGLKLRVSTINTNKLLAYIKNNDIKCEHFKKKLWEDEQNLRAVILNSNGKSEILKKLNIKTNAGNFDTLNRYIIKYKIDLSHFDSDLLKESRVRGIKEYRKRRALIKEDVFVENSDCTRATARLFIERFKLLEYKCAFGHEAIWEGKKLVLHLDHINGIANDNRIENLRYLCPNCHSQTHTYSGKNIKNNKEIKEVVKNERVVREHKTKIVWPSNEELQKLLNMYPMSKLAKQLNVTDRTIRKRAQTRNLNVPTDIYGQGYWSKDRVKKNERL